MDNNLTDEEVRNIAARARLEFSAEELDAMRKHLCIKLESFKLFDKIKTDGVMPTERGADIIDALRDDECRKSTPRDGILSGAPEMDGGMFVVPRTVE